MKITQHLARFIPDDPGVVGLSESAVLALLEAWGLAPIYQEEWSWRDGICPPVGKRQSRRLATTTWANHQDLSDYFQLALDEGRTRGHEWRQLVPEIAKRVPREGHHVLLFVLAAGCYRRERGDFEQCYLLDAFAEAVGVLIDPILPSVSEHFARTFDYHYASELLAGADRDRDHQQVVELLMRTGMWLPELAVLPRSGATLHAAVVFFSDYTTTATLTLIPESELDDVMRLALGAADGACFADSADAAGSEWYAIMRVMSALGEDVASHYDEWLRGCDTGDGCPSRDELSALEGSWSERPQVEFEDGSQTGDHTLGLAGDLKINRLVFLHRAM